MLICLHTKQSYALSTLKKLEIESCEYLISDKIRKI